MCSLTRPWFQQPVSERKRHAQLGELKEQLLVLQKEDDEISLKRSHAISVLIRRSVGWFIWLVILGATFTGCGFLMRQFLEFKGAAKQDGSELSLVHEYMLVNRSLFGGVSLTFLFNRFLWPFALTFLFANG